MEIVIIELSFLGILLADYIYTHKKEEKKLVCPLNFSCDEVIRSDYSKFLNIDVAFLGFLYYLFVFLGYAFYLLFDLNFPALHLILFFASLCAFLFSVYLTFIQLIKLKKLCSFCIASFLISFLIFLAAYNLYGAGMAEIARAVKNVVLFIHAFSAGVGMGIVIAVNFLFFKFLKDEKISKSEKFVLDNLSHLLLSFIALILGSGFFIYLSDMVKYHSSSKFLLKMFIFLVLLLNGVVLNVFISPQIGKPSFWKNGLNRVICISSGVISFFSWFFAFLLGRMKSLPFSLKGGVFIYFIIVLFFVLISNLFYKKKFGGKPD
jgi:uncharacterized membrane protein